MTNRPGIWLSLIVVTLLVLFMTTFTVGPLEPDPFCAESHGRLSVYLEHDDKAGLSVKYGFGLICDAYKSTAPVQTTHPAPGNGGPWSP